MQAIVPRATYRLQLNQDFGFAQALALLPYLAALGISHLYLSPILQARAGSRHGYDTIEHARINPELGTLEAFRHLAGAARGRGIGIILDFVPNHMGIGGQENAYWLDVLEHGQASRYAHWFDIDWAPPHPTLKGKVLVPVLGCSYAEALAGGRLVLKCAPETGRFAIWADGATLLPVAPESVGMIGGPQGVAAINADPARLDALIQRQHWWVAHFSEAAGAINYRRFFIINDLAGIRIEDPEVFEHVHALLFQLIGEGLVDGLRIDHVDGLADPRAYLRRLRQRAPRPIYLVVEKILAPHEQLRPDWGVDGTTGYEFAAQVTALGTDPEGEAALTRAYQAFCGERREFGEIEREAKLVIIDGEMRAELDRLARLAQAAGGPDPDALRPVLRQLAAAMPVYRSYADARGTGAMDRRDNAVALARARRAEPALDAGACEFLADLLCHKGRPGDAAAEFIRRLQQFCGPVMAKGLEDTALYRYNRLIALNDVGALPDRFSRSVAAFHAFNAARLARFSQAMLTSSSHDTKRGEDTRARIVALSGHARDWADAVREWQTMLGPAAGAVDRNDLWAFFQLLLGAWPVEFPDSGPIPGLAAFRVRLQAAMRKSVREARINSSWAAPNLVYETGLAGLIDAALREAPDNVFLGSFRRFAAKIAVEGARVGLAQAVLKFTSPGVPDLYQGAELWEQSMVDPDNRRDVDFALRQRLLAGDDGGKLALDDWRDGSVKPRVIRRLLRLRAEHPELFARGSYEPIVIDEGVCAFLRRQGRAALVVAVALRPWRGAVGDGEIPLPGDVPPGRWRELFSTAECVPHLGALEPLSVAVWVMQYGDEPREPA